MIPKLDKLVFISLIFMNLSAVYCKSIENVKKRPNIVMIVADDLGSYDVSLSGNDEILTPNIDALGYQGVVFNRHYTQALCGPSRAALLTGKYPIHTGMQHFVIFPDEPRGLPLNLKILPEYLKEVGYKTHIVGKWHLGYARKSFIPTRRGFDSHVGFLGGYVAYYNYTEIFRDYIPGFDFYHNEEVYNDVVGHYLTDVLTDEATKIIGNHNSEDGPIMLYLAHGAPHAINASDPLEVNPEDLETVAHIKDPDRRKYAAMVKALDRSVGKVVTTLKEKDLLENTIILYFSDNGGPTIGLWENTGSNYPLRGQKDSPWEGAVRGLAAVWSPLFQKRHYVSSHMIHITDWLPTFLQASGTPSYRSETFDGFDIWSTLDYNKPPAREEMVQSFDPVDGYTAYYFNGWKYINGTTWNGIYDTWIGSRSFDLNPEASSYADVVMKSPVWQALNPFATRLLKPNDVDDIRRKTKITCQRQYESLNTCNPLRAPCLFYLDADPCEMNNLADAQPGRVVELQKRIREVEKTMLPPGNLPSDPKADPALNDGLWTWWLDRLQEVAESQNFLIENNFE
ncbi:arylsulfatase B-like [Lutzomyia longipalpis]|uniref:arylsulfatase B-like n=1 Tax=Lutzomyia longipalpis TaxID=7200 RepID=UPI0024843D16|nr:arylsulfatase B-like [Lutzomyia longipalpis]